MTDTTDHLTTDPDARRTAVTWVTGTGAFLLLVAAGVFVGVRWDDIPAAAKLGVITGLTGAFLLIGHRLRTSLPATGAALFHLGAFLVPVDVAAVGARLDGGWEELLLAEGLTGALLFPLLARVARSNVLAWAATASVAAFAAGLGATTDLPALGLLTLAGAAVAADVAGLHRPAVALALAAGAAPMVFAAPGWALLSAAGSAFVLAREARRRVDAVYAVLAVVAGGVGLATSWIAADLPASSDWAALAALFLATEVAALLLHRDPVWTIPATTGAVLAEIGAVAGVLAAALTVLLAPVADDPFLGIGDDPSTAVAFALLATGWVAADLRRRADDATPVGFQLLLGGGWAPATPAIAVSAVAAVVHATGSPAAAAVAMVAVSGLALASGRPLGHPTGALLAGWAAVTAWTGPLPLHAGVAVAGGLAVAEMAVVRFRVATPTTRPRTALAAPVLTGMALVPFAVLALRVDAELRPLTGLLAAALGAWLVAAVVDRGDAGLGYLARTAGLAVLAFAGELRTADLAALGAVLTALAAIDAARRDDHRIAFGAAVTVPLTVATLVMAAGVTPAYAGVALSLTAVVTAGLAAVVGEARWARPFVAIAVVSAGVGLGMSTPDPRAFADSLLITGGLVIVGGVVIREADVAHGGGVLATVGVWAHLVTSSVVASEAYLAPVALQLVVAGMTTRRDRPVSSWVAYGPAVAALGGSALAERVWGGGAWHALVAGAVGVAAVAAGGARRLAAPLVLGTVLLVAVSIHESIAVTATVPTWGWLALGGSVLLAAGIAMERAGTTPMETGRRLVDVVQERFA